MNILRKCMLINTQRINCLINIDQLIKERFSSSAIDLTEPVDFYLMLYFSANRLPAASNKLLNSKLEAFHKKQRDQKHFEIIFISSDKTLDQFELFLEQNKFINYALFFEDQDLNVTLLWV